MGLGRGLKTCEASLNKCEVGFRVSLASKSVNEASLTEHEAGLILVVKIENTVFSSQKV